MGTPKNRINARGRIARDGFSWPQQGYWPLLYAHLYSEDGDVAPGSRKSEMLRLMLVGYMHENGLVEDEPARRSVSHRRVKNAPKEVRQNVSHADASPGDPRNEDRPVSVENDGKRRKVSGSAEHHPSELVRPDIPNGESDLSGSSSNGEKRTTKSQLSTKTVSIPSEEINDFSKDKTESSQSPTGQRNDDTKTEDHKAEIVEHRGDIQTNKSDEVMSERDIVGEDETPSHTSPDKAEVNGGNLGGFDPSNYCA
ncbi:hypothetical protein AA14337_0762 [Acetobacter malorum DSM 14337]|uniref:Uncharacterized protein n=1 Tax=Acetobacter malorum DSM 14337 TaxID=1307910 RepID=A0ABQ0PPW4_9PROT|nr:hypothetical protein [Acetobacter malorum]KXV08730.1 hypothetical protein AD930_03730 [Acetobacter malorum]GBQ77247.1 hypothetical protein AA14337_0762 [Acetobacter malorum DSM 14337]